MKHAKLFSLIFLSIASLASAADAADTAVKAAPISGAGSLFQVLLSLFLVLGLMMAAAWAVKKFGPKRLSSTAAIRVVGGVNLGGRERIVMVEVADQWIVVGVAPGQVSALATLPKQEGAAVLPETAPMGKNFADWLKQTIDKRNGN